MRRTARPIVIGSVLATALGGAALAKPMDDLLANGFYVLRTTKVMGDFEGCERERQVQLADGGVFTCAGFGYLHAHNPKAVVLKSKAGKYKLVIQDVVYDGVFS